MPATRTATASARYTSTPWRVSGHCSAPGCVRIAASRKRSCQSTSASLSSCTTRAGAEKPCSVPLSLPWSGDVLHHPGSRQEPCKIRPVHAVLREEEPARQPLLDGMGAITGAVLRQQVHEGQGVARDEPMQARAASERAVERLLLHPRRLTRNLDEGTASHHLVLKENRHSDHALRANRRDLDRRPIFEFRYQRHDAPMRKIDVLDRTFRLVEALPEGERHLFEIGL